MFLINGTAIGMSSAVC